MKDDKLEHVGVIGMKWGVRRADRRSALSERWSKNLGSVGLKGLSESAHRKALSEKGKANELRTAVKAKERERFKKNLEQARKRSKDVKGAIDSLVQEGITSAARRGKKFSVKKDRQYWENFFKGSIKVKDIKRSKDRMTRVQNKVEDLLAAVGDMIV
jgi:hypothetical protein